MLQTNLIPGIYHRFPSMMWSHALVWWWATNAASSQQPLVDPAVIRARWGPGPAEPSLGSLVRSLVQRLCGPWDNKSTCQPLAWPGTVTVLKTHRKGGDGCGGNAEGGAGRQGCSLAVICQLLETSNAEPSRVRVAPLCLIGCPQ